MTPSPPDDGSQNQIVVVGGGLAGARAATFLASRSRPRESVVLVGEEPDLPYNRPMLSKDFFSEGSPSTSLWLHERPHYDRLGIQLLLGERAAALEVSGNQVRLASGRSIPYKQLLIATGGTPRTLPVDGFALPGVHLLRNLSDATAIRGRLPGAKRAVVIGGGFIGLEAAAMLRSQGVAVTLVETAAETMGPLLGPTVGALLRRMHEANGVDVRTSATASSFSGDHEVAAVELSDGESIPADIVIVGVGIRPAVEWLEGSGVAVDDGVLVNDYCMTNVENVYAAGDVCRWRHPYFGSLRIEHETHAQTQGMSAARAMLTGRAAAGGVPFAWSQQFGQELRYIGHAREWEDLIVEREPATGRAAALYITSGEVRAVFSLNHNELSAALLQEMQASLPLPVSRAKAVIKGFV
jgi:NAD(P)H-nitrite reductase large subunit